MSITRAPWSAEQVERMRVELEGVAGLTDYGCDVSLGSDELSSSGIRCAGCKTLNQIVPIEWTDPDLVAFGLADPSPPIISRST